MDGINAAELKKTPAQNLRRPRIHPAMSDVTSITIPDSTRLDWTITTTEEGATT